MQQHLTKHMDRISNKVSSNNRTKTQQDNNSNIYIYTGKILSQNSQGNQKKMQRHIYCAPMTG